MLSAVKGHSWLISFFSFFVIVCAWIAIVLVRDFFVKKFNFLKKASFISLTVVHKVIVHKGTDFGVGPKIGVGQKFGLGLSLMYPSDN